jgi:carbamoyl-phosphate synthase small subunit
MKFGHHGANHPVMDDRTKQVFITSQNHGFTVDEKTLPPTLQAINHSLFDGSLQGIQHQNKPWFSFQGHPEASPGPHDVQGLFHQFIDLVKNYSRTSYAETK